MKLVEALRNIGNDAYYWPIYARKEGSGIGPKKGKIMEVTKDDKVILKLEDLTTQKASLQSLTLASEKKW